MIFVLFGAFEGFWYGCLFRFIRNRKCDVYELAYLRKIYTESIHVHAVEETCKAFIESAQTLMH